VEPIQYGIEKLGRLTSVLLHRPDRSLPKITEENREFFLFDKVPDVDKYLEEHLLYGRLLERHGVKVYLLSDHVRRCRDLMDRLPNLAYLHDTAAVSSFGAIVSKMASRGRGHEEVVVGEALKDLGIPILYEPPEGDAFEGCLLLGPKTVFVADTERHGVRSIVRFIEFILGRFEEVIYARIPQERRFMHPDMVLGRVTDNLMVYYPPAFLATYLITKESKKQIDLKTFMTKRRIDLFPISDNEQKQWGSSFVPLEPGVVINYDISLEASSVRLLEREGIRFIHFHPDALLAGGGSLRCLTLRLCRVSQRFTEILYSHPQYESVSQA
jgi:arginine deiminase